MPKILLCQYTGCQKAGFYSHVKKNMRFCAVHRPCGAIVNRAYRCRQTGCTKQASFALCRGRKATACIAHKSSKMINVRIQRCSFPFCTVSARFGFAGEKATTCARHKHRKMINVKVPTCVNNTCQLRAMYNIPGLRPTFCSAHRLRGMVNVNAKRCQYPGCSSQPFFGTGGGTAKFCSAHKSIMMTNLYANVCEFDGCTVTASFNFRGEKPRFCATHKKSKMVNMRNRMCEEKECTKQPLYNFKGQPARFCATHREPKMVDVKHALCEHRECDRRATYGILGSRPVSCKTHRQRGMLLRPQRRCVVCRAPATHGTTSAVHCETHKTDTEINLIEQQCRECKLIMLLDDNELCEFCCPQKRQRYALAKQNEVMNFLDANGLHGTQTDKTVNGGVCGNERPDRVFELIDRVIVLEVDEHQHRERPCECEQTRMINVSQSFGGRPVLWIRYNPDTYRPGPFNCRKQVVMCEKHPPTLRMRVLVNVIRNMLEARSLIPDAFVSVMYLFFDGWKDGIGETEWHVIMPWNKG